MKVPLTFLYLAGLLIASATSTSFSAAPELNDPGWPRAFKKDGKRLTVHQPQVDHWQGYTNLQFRCAIAVKGVAKEEKFGVAEIEAQTATDHEARTVKVLTAKRDVRFANVPEPELSQLRQSVEELYPPGQVTTLALERVLAYLDPKEETVQRAVQVNLDPPKIFGSSRPAILVMFMGEPQFRPVATNRTDLEFAINTNWDILYDTASRQFYLLNGEGWLTAPDLLQGPWIAAQSLPPSILNLPVDENWLEAKKQIPGKPPRRVPTVFVTTQPAEMILVDGSPKYVSIQGTQLQRVENTESMLFLHKGQNKLYYVVAGRWFRSDSLTGPWNPASEDLPEDFAKIPPNDRAAIVKASVPGTSEAKDAVLLASIPKSTEVSLTNAGPKISYSGEPKFVPITDTTVQYAVNSPNAVFLVDGSYYCCLDGAWFNSSDPMGPWVACKKVPDVIYSIPPSHPMHHVTYVKVQETTEDAVTYAHTAGYNGEYVTTNGVVMFGTGMSEGAPAYTDPGYYYYWYWYPWCYTYGIGAGYYYYHGGYYRGYYGAYGPYGGVGFTAAYNPYTGAYARAGSVYGPYGGTAARASAYNPATGARAAGARIDTGWGSAGRAAAYNPMTGQGAAGAYRSSQYGTAAAVKSTQGSAAAWNTVNGRGAVAKTESGNVYAAHDGSVYRKDANGNWWQNSGNGWENTSRPQPVRNADRQAQAQAQAQAYRQQQAQQAQARATAQQQQAAQAAQQRQNMERQAQARQAGNQQAARAKQYNAQPRSGGSRGYAGRSYGGGGIRIGRR